LFVLGTATLPACASILGFDEPVHRHDSAGAAGAGASGAGGMSVGGTTDMGGTGASGAGGMNVGGTTDMGGTRANGAGGTNLGGGAGTSGEAGHSAGGENQAGAGESGDTGQSGSGVSGSSGGSGCVGETCLGCTIGGSFYPSGTGEPGNVICRSCDPTTSTSAWTPSRDGTHCAPSQVCNRGVCKTGCFIDGTYCNAGTGQPGNTTCETCDPTNSLSAWTAAGDGTTCGPQEFCHLGSCASGCVIGGTYYAEGTVNGCQSCQPEKSTSAWTDADGIACEGGGTCCSGTCDDLMTSNTNCGGCGLECHTTCTSGECVVQACIDFATSGNYTAFGVDGSSAYLSHTSEGGANIQSMSLTGCTFGPNDPDYGDFEAVAALRANANGAVYTVNTYPWPTYQVRFVHGVQFTIVGATQSIDGPLTLDATNAYWLDSSAGILWKAPLSGGGSPTPLSAIGGATGIAVNATSVYWSDGTLIRRVPIAGGTADTFVSGTSPAALSVDGSNVYWTTANGNLYRQALESTSAIRLMQGPEGFKYLAFGPATLYWSDGTHIKAVSLAGGAVGTDSVSLPRTLYTAPSSANLFGLAVWGNSLYWVDLDTRSLMKLTPN
jgi:hypothetical protein